MSKIKVGDKVRIRVPAGSSFNLEETCTSGVWKGIDYFPEYMKKQVNKYGVVEKIDDYGPQGICVRGWWWPEAWLEKIEPSKKHAWGLFSKDADKLLAVVPTRRIGRLIKQPDEVVRKISYTIEG